MADSTKDGEGKKAKGKKGSGSAYEISGSADGAPGDADLATPDSVNLFDGALGDGLKQAFSKYVAENVRKDGEEGDVDVNLDIPFLREHGAALVGSLMESLAKSILPENLQVNVPMSPAEGGGEDTSAKGKGKGKGKSKETIVEKRVPNVSLNFDAMNFLKSLFAAPTQNAAAPVRDEDDDDDELDD